MDHQGFILVGNHGIQGDGTQARVSQDLGQARNMSIATSGYNKPKQLSRLRVQSSELQALTTCVPYFFPHTWSVVNDFDGWASGTEIDLAIWMGSADPLLLEV